MYLYVFESGDVWQMPLPPTEVDIESVKLGNLCVYAIESGKFQELSADGEWKNVPLGGRFLDPQSGKDYSYVSETTNREQADGFGDSRAADDALTPEHVDSTP